MVKVFLILLGRILVVGAIQSAFAVNARGQRLTPFAYVILIPIGIVGISFGLYCWWWAYAVWPWWYVSMAIFAAGSLPFGWGWLAFVAASGASPSPEMERFLTGSKELRL